MGKLTKIFLPIVLFMNNVMGAVLEAKDLNKMPGIGTVWTVSDVLEKVNGAEDEEGPYEIIEYAWSFMDKGAYYKAARWICLAWYKGYSDGNAISGWVDDWRNAGQKEDLKTLIKDSTRHKRIAGILAKQWAKDCQPREFDTKGIEEMVASDEDSDSESDEGEEEAGSAGAPKFVNAYLRILVPTRQLYMLHPLDMKLTSLIRDLNNSISILI
jgi:hypothetical protein